MDRREFSKPFKAAGIFTILGFLPSVLSVIMLPIYLKYLNPEEYGTLAILMLFGGFYAIFSCLQLNAAASTDYFKYEKQGQKEEYVSTMVSSIALISFISYILFLGLGVLFFDFFLDESEVSFFREGIIILSTTFLSQISGIYLLFLKNQYVFREYASYTVTFIFLNLIFQYSFIVLLSYGVLGSVLGSLMARMVVTSFMLIKNRKIFTIRPNREMLFKSLSFSLPLIPVIFINWFLTTGDRLFLQRLMDLSSVGRYALLINLLLMANMAFTSLWGAFTPRLLTYFNHLTNDNYIICKKFVDWHVKIGLIVLSGVIMVGSNLDLITDNQKYLSVIPLFSSGAIVMLPRVFKIVSNLQLMHKRKSRLIAFNALISMVVLIIGFVILIPSLGINGALLSLGLSNTIGFAFLYYLSRVHSNITLLRKQNVYDVLISVLIISASYYFVDWMKWSLGIYGMLSFLLVLLFMVFTSITDIRQQFLNTGDVKVVK